MKLSHVIVAIVFFILGAACVVAFKVVSISCKTPVQHAVVTKAPAGGSSSGIAVGGTAMGKSFSYKRETTTLPAAKTVKFRIEKDVNRQASDYRDFEMAKDADYTVCQKACQDETKCVAFTYVKAGPRGAVPHCWLKHSVPQAYADDQCITGVRE